MHPDELNKPLGLDADAPAERREIPWSALAFGGLAILGVGVFAFARLTEPSAPDASTTLSSIAPVRPPVRAPEAAPAEGQASFEDVTASIRTPSRATATEVEQASGVRVVRQGGAATPGALIITVPAPDGERTGDRP